MKKINWKILIITFIVCLLPIILGIVFYNKLPEQMPVHFNINNEPDNYASKNFALFAIPVILTALQVFCCIISDIRKANNTKEPKFISIIKWFIPVLSIVISTIMIGISLGTTIDVRKIICLVLGIMYVLTGNYLPKMNYESAKGKIHPMPKDEKLFRRMARALGYTFVIFGIILLITMLFNEIVTTSVIITFVLILIVESIYCIVKNKHK